MNKRWAIINFGENNYSVSDHGDIRNDRTGLIMKSGKQNSGYFFIHLTSKGKVKSFLIHRLVAMSFVNNVDRKPMVDHIDAVKTNNNYTNLRWVTPHENMRYAVKSGCMVNVAAKAAKRMVKLGELYGFDNSQKYLKKAIPVTLVINGKDVYFRSGRQASIHLKIDHKTLTSRINRGAYSHSNKLQF